MAGERILIVEDDERIGPSLLARIRAQFRRAEPRPHPRWFTIFRPGPDPQIDIVLQRVLSPGR